MAEEPQIGRRRRAWSVALDRFATEAMTSTESRQPTAPSMVHRLGDVLSEAVYGQPHGARVPTLLLAAGQRIETERQLRLLREAGYRVLLPSESARSTEHSPHVAQATAISDVSEAITDVGFTQFQPQFAHRLEAATQVRQAATRAASDLMGRIWTGVPPDMKAMQEASSTLVSEVTADPQAVAALVFLLQCDDYTVEHSADVAILMVAIGRVLDVPLPELRILALGGLMHDAGKQRVPPGILDKPGKLSPAEFEEIRKHPQHGFDLLGECANCPQVVRTVALQHHERLDGSGYPAGLTQTELHPYSCIAAVADTFDAMTADRSYRKGQSPRQAVLELYGAAGKRLDTSAVQALIKLVGVYPVGTRVVLNAGQRGLVIAPNPNDSTRPAVLIDQDRNGRPVAAPFVLDLSAGAGCIVGTMPRGTVVARPADHRQRASASPLPDSYRLD
jgi:HD-GYP domain-containing protein (c-di-GMP phosphodiesterase class II)